MQRYEFLRTIFITHNHPDHDLGLVAVMGNDYYTEENAGRAHSTLTSTVRRKRRI